MILYVEELRSVPLIQTIFKTDTSVLDRVRLHLYKHTAPPGTFIVSILDDQDNVLTSTSQTLAEMYEIGSDKLIKPYYHGYISFIFNTKLTLKPGIYKIQLSATDYVFSDNAFIGWCKAWYDRTIPITDGAEPSPANSPYDLELYSLERMR